MMSSTCAAVASRIFAKFGGGDDDDEGAAPSEVDAEAVGSLVSAYVDSSSDEYALLRASIARRSDEGGRLSRAALVDALDAWAEAIADRRSPIETPESPPPPPPDDRERERLLAKLDDERRLSALRAKTLEETYAALADDNEALRARLREEAARVADLKAALRERVDEAADAVRGELEPRLSLLRDAERRADAERRRLRERVETLAREKNELEARLDEALRERARLANENRELLRTINALQEQRRTLTSQIAERTESFRALLETKKSIEEDLHYILHESEFFPPRETAATSTPRNRLSLADELNSSGSGGGRTYRVADEPFSFEEDDSSTQVEFEERPEVDVENVKTHARLLDAYARKLEIDLAEADVATTALRNMAMEMCLPVQYKPQTIYTRAPEACERKRVISRIESIARLCWTAIKVLFVACLVLWPSSFVDSIIRFEEFAFQVGALERKPFGHPPT